MQQIIVFIITGIAIGYAGWKIYKTLNNPCRGCEGCEIKKKMQRNKDANETHSIISNRKHSCFKEKS